MPTVWQAWHEGRISTTVVTSVDRAASRLTQAESIAALDAIAVDRLARLTPGQATRWLDAWVERTEASESRRRHEIAYGDLKVGLRPLGDGMTRMTADITSIDAAAIMQSLSGAVHQLPADDDRTIDQARALRDESSLLYRLVTDDVGNLMTVTWLGRFAPVRLDQLLDFRDGTSVFPTSSVPARMCDIDHSEPWPAETSAANTGPLNRRAHHLKTEGHLQLRQPRPGVFEWTTRTGHTYTRSPAPVPVADWDLTASSRHVMSGLPVDPWAAEFAEMLEALDAAKPLRHVRS